MKIINNILVAIAMTPFLWSGSLESKIFDSSSSAHPFVYKGVSRLSPPKINHVYKVKFIDGRIVKIYAFPKSLKDVKTYLIQNVSTETKKTETVPVKIVMDLDGLRLYR